MLNINSPQLSRNYGFWSEREQGAILQAKIAIAGVGGDGFQLGLKLAQIGFTRFSVADPEVFEIENTNRVPGALQSTYGKNKAEVFRGCIYDINPDAEVTIFTEGVHEDNIAEFMEGATVVLDESELTLPYIGTMIAREARRRGIPDIFVTNVGFAGVATAFKPRGGKTFEWMMGLRENMSLDEVRWMPNPDDQNSKNAVARLPRKAKMDRCLPYLPKRYADLRTLTAIQEGASLPSLATGVDAAAAVGETEVLKHVFSGISDRWPEPTWAPHFRYMDAMTGKSGLIRFPLLSHYRYLTSTIIRNYFLLNPKSSYTSEDRERRRAAHEAEKKRVQ